MTRCCLLLFVALDTFTKAWLNFTSMSTLLPTVLCLALFATSHLRIPAKKFTRNKVLWWYSIIENRGRSNNRSTNVSEAMPKPPPDPSHVSFNKILHFNLRSGAGYYQLTFCLVRYDTLHFPLLGPSVRTTPTKITKYDEMANISYSTSIFFYFW